jgi:3-phenylpropionate/trans-cinnamate dioxygenase ferredoxin component
VRGNWVRVCGTTEVPEEGAVRILLSDGRALCVARTGGRLHAVDDVCSHADVALSDGEVEDGMIECWLHGSRFDLTTGRPIGLPATQPVATYPVKNDGGDVLVAIEEKK